MRLLAERERDVRQRSGRDEQDLAGALAGGLRDQLDRRAIEGGGRRWRPRPSPRSPWTTGNGTWSRASGRAAPAPPRRPASLRPRAPPACSRSPARPRCSPSRSSRRSARPPVTPRRRAARARRRRRCRRPSARARAPWPAQGTEAVDAPPAPGRTRSAWPRPRGSPAACRRASRRRGPSAPGSRARRSRRRSGSRARRRPSRPGTRRSRGRAGRCRRSSAASAGSGPRAPSPSRVAERAHPDLDPERPFVEEENSGSRPGTESSISRSSCSRADGFFRSSRDRRR